MIRRDVIRRSVIRRAEVLVAEGRRLRLLDGPLAGEECEGVPFDGSPSDKSPSVGEVVLVNSVGLEMGLGTGGLVFVLPGPGGEVPENADHFVKLPYTPLQFPTLAGERRRRDLSGVPVIVLPLHSHLAPACCAVAALAPEKSVSFVWQEGGALSVEISETVWDLKERGLLGSVVSSGSCFGGDVEAPNIYSALLAAEGDVVLVGIGPGVVGTAGEYAHGGMSAALALNAAVALGARPVLAPRVSFSDERRRHYGLSHHTVSALEAALSGCRVALPVGACGSLENDALPERHEAVAVEWGAAGLQESFGLTFQSMGRSYEDDRNFFDAAAAAVWLALGDPA